MDLRKYISNDSDLHELASYVLQGRFVYQPFIVHDNLQVGAGMEFTGCEYSGLVYWPGCTAAGFDRFLIKNEVRDIFFDSNNRLRTMYDNFIDSICSALGNINNLSFAEVGCNTGYFLFGLAMRGAGSASGYDRENYADVFKLMNRLLGTDVNFYNSSYEGKTNSIQGIKDYDVILSVAVLCHLSDTLQHLAFLGRHARKALFIWSPVTREDNYSIQFGEPNKYYNVDQFPYCFDNLVRPSSKLLVKSLQLMGFTRIIPIYNCANGMPDGFYNAHDALIAIRD